MDRTYRLQPPLGISAHDCITRIHITVVMEVAITTERGKTREYENVLKVITEGSDVRMIRLSDGEEEEITIQGSIFNRAAASFRIRSALTATK